MTSKYWIKLYHETLHDPKMGRLSDHLYRRCIEIFLLAGENDQGGLLPALEDMAWTLRADPDTLAQDLRALADVNITHWTEDGWVVTHFAERQDHDTPAERMRQLRKRKQHATYSGDVPVTKRNTDIDIEKIRVDGDKERPPAPPPAKLYRNTQAVVMYRDVFQVEPNEGQAAKMTAAVLNFEVWGKTLEHWNMHGWKANNIPGILDLYKRGGVCNACAAATAPPGKNGKREMTEEEKLAERERLYPTYRAGDEIVKGIR